MFDQIPDMAARRADLGLSDLAFRDLDQTRDWSFTEVNAAANGVAAGLRAAGLRMGDRLAVLCQNRAEFFVLLFACQKTGIILCPLNWRQPGPELIDTLGRFTPRALISEGAFANLGEEVAKALRCKHWRFEEEVADWIAAGGPGSAGMIPADRPWYLLFTSGTTGRPKAVIQTARMAWANAINIGQAVQLTSADRSLNFLPLFHTAGINLYTLPVFLCGARSTILRKFDAGAALDLIAKGEVTQFFGVSAIYQAFSLAPEVEAIDWSALRCGCGGAPLSEPLIRFFAARGCKVLNGFGMTETGPTAFLMDENHAESKLGSVGRPRGAVSRPQYHPRLFRRPRGDGSGLSGWRLAALGRCRAAGCGWLCLGGGPDQGHVHLGRRKRLSGRGGTGAGRTPGGA